MFGLHNQLVLRAKDPMTRFLPRSRSVLIPHGDICFSEQDHHVSVTISPSSDRQVLFHRYLVDTDLGYLASDAGLTSRLFKIYLHALTSHCLPDPLTGRTGTEEALSELSEPASSSFEQIDKEQAKLLMLIGSLTPKREFYPAHLKCMQTTHWSNLPSLSQHFAFSTAASIILDHANTLQLFHTLNFELQGFTLASESTLVKRAGRRSSFYYPQGDLDCVTQIIGCPESRDHISVGRDSWTSQWTLSGQAAAWTSSVAFRSWGQPSYKPFDLTYDLVSLLESWGNVEGVTENLDLAYSSRWLNLVLPSSWMTVYSLCRDANSTSNKYALSTCLATAGFSQKIPPDLMAILIAFASNPAFRHLASLSDPCFALADGYQPTQDRVEMFVSHHTRTLENTPASLLSPQHEEFEQDSEMRQQAFYDRQIQSYKAEFVQDLINQWPADRLVAPSLAYSLWFRTESCLAEVERYFSSCLRNVRLRDHLRAIEEILSSQPAVEGASPSVVEPPAVELVNFSGASSRPVYYLPFGRHIRLDRPKAQQLQVLYAGCMQAGGIILAQPEHILSFKLMGIDHLISPSTEKALSTAHQLQAIQHWLTQNTRDILDESDEILHVRYQLVYTVGEQQPLEGHPDRWTTTQQILQLTAYHIAQLQARHPDSFKHEERQQGQFPSIRIMPDCDDRIQQNLVHGLARDILAGRILNLNCGRLPISVREVLIRFLAEKELSYSVYQQLRYDCDVVMWRGLLLARGLLALGVLIFALKAKHYRVDYGLDLSRSLLAVPYRAKDIPSLRAEFGHPDVSVVLTYLCYYYKGLTDDQLDNCFEILYKLDNPSLEYEQWVARNPATPPNLNQLSGVNIKDQEQFKRQIIPTFSRNSAVVDFFLSSVVFPKAANDFPRKLSTSAWDLAELKPYITTGFSGTNDNQYLLPTSITQADPVKQLSTNALVLTYLLQPENNHYICMRDEDGRNLDAMGFLRLLVFQTPEIRVLLDVGAQMLELQNEELARRWLELRPDIEAAVYFNEEDELVALPQSGTPVPLYLSSFAQRLDQCIVYLDDGHTRGTDLKLPRSTRALVTLGPKVTKDRLLQGCMRMRLLGHGQSVLFAAPPEIDRLIRSKRLSQAARY